MKGENHGSNKRKGRPTRPGDPRENIRQLASARIPHPKYNTPPAPCQGPDPAGGRPFDGCRHRGRHRAVISTIAGGRENVTELPKPTAEQPAVVVTTPAASTQTPEPTEAPVRFYLSASERDTVERVVMAESGGESFEGQMLVAQCILNAAEKEGVQPSEAVVIYSYTSNRPDPTQSVKDAVTAVFDRGEVAIDAHVMYFYNPALVTSDWHESQIFVAEVGGHRFFAERSPAA